MAATKQRSKIFGLLLSKGIPSCQVIVINELRVANQSGIYLNGKLKIQH
jgi:hypothetical protein